MRKNRENWKSLRDSKREQFTLFLNEKSSVVVSSKKRAKHLAKSDSWYYFGVVGQIGYAIALPVAGGALLGKLLDQYWASYPRATVSLISVGSIISLGGFIQTIQELIKKK